MGQARVIRLCVATAARRRWRALLLTALVLGVLGGAALGAFAGARRTQSAYPRFLAAGHPSDLAVNNFTDDGTDGVVLASLPEVEQTGSWASFNVFPLADDGTPDLDATSGEAVGSIDGQYFTQDRVGIVDGRMSDPDEVGEIVVSEFAHEVEGYEVGDRRRLAVYTDEQLADEAFLEELPTPFAEVDMTIVGVGVFPDEVVQHESDRIPRYLLTPAFATQNAEAASYVWHHLVLKRGEADVAAVESRYVAERPESAGAVFRHHAEDVARAQVAIRPAALALAFFGAAMALATLALVGLALARQVRTDEDTDDVLRALGAPRRAVAGKAIALSAIPILAGTVLAVLVGVAVSPAMPIGPVRRIEVDPGVAFDWTVLGLGALAFVACLFGVVVIAVATQDRARARVARPSRVVQLAASAGLRPAAVAGARLALEPGHGRTAVPVRWVLAGTSLAITALVSALCFASSLDTLVATPRLYGWDWDATLLDTGGYGVIDVESFADLVDDDPRVDGWAPVYFGADDIDGHNVPLIGLEPGSTVGPPILEGRAATTPEEIVVGTSTLDVLDKELGDEVELAGGGRPSIARIVGIATLPTLGQVHGNHPSLGIGAVVAPELVPGALGDGPASPAAFVRYADGENADEVEAWLREATAGIGEFPGSTEVFRSRRPAEIAHSDDIGAAPTVVAGALALAALVALALVLSVSIARRRRDLALLKVMGFTRRDVSIAVAWQATITIAFGLAIGIPLGVLGGTWMWRRFAEQLDVVPSATIPVLALVILAVAAILLCNLVAAVPARVAGRTRAAVALRTE